MDSLFSGVMLIAGILVLLWVCWAYEKPISRFFSRLVNRFSTMDFPEKYRLPEELIKTLEEVPYRTAEIGNPFTTSLSPFMVKGVSLNQFSVFRTAGSQGGATTCLINGSDEHGIHHSCTITLDPFGVAISLVSHTSGSAPGSRKRVTCDPGEIVLNPLLLIDYVIEESEDLIKARGHHPIITPVLIGIACHALIYSLRAFPETSYPTDSELTPLA
jgi:hypothetical protein